MVSATLEFDTVSNEGVEITTPPPVYNSSYYCATGERDANSKGPGGSPRPTM